MRLAMGHGATSDTLDPAEIQAAYDTLAGR